MSPRGRTSLARRTLLLAGTLLFALPAPLLALHFVADEEGGCYACHSLNAEESDPKTSAINAVFRTLPRMRAANGGVTPERFGCTYCHNNSADRRMKGVLDDFLPPRVSRHPVGVTFGTAGGTETANAFLSAVGSQTPGELDCVDCHDQALLAPGLPESYLGHLSRDSEARRNNPAMLRGVTQPGENDDHCRLCHSNAGTNVKGAPLTLVSHADAGPGGPLLESDGTKLKATAGGGNRQCAVCHATHGSNLVRLLNDGRGGATAIIGTNCTQVCHYPGDDIGYLDSADNVFARRGHGKPKSTYKYRGGTVNYTGGSYKTMGMSCGSCHVSLDTGTTGPSRKPHVERAPPGATSAERYKRRFNISLPVQDESGGSLFGNPVLGICENCHATYAGHRGGDGSVGCLDCHDEHAEGSGPGNLFMIPVLSKRTGSWTSPARERGGKEAILYTAPRLSPEKGEARTGATDFFRVGGSAGICDSQECHPGFTPLADFMKSGKHAGGALAPGADCGACHKHAGPAGSFNAK